MNNLIYNNNNNIKTASSMKYFTTEKNEQSERDDVYLAQNNNTSSNSFSKISNILINFKTIDDDEFNNIVERLLNKYSKAWSTLANK